MERSGFISINFLRILKNFSVRENTKIMPWVQTRDVFGTNRLPLIPSPLMVNCELKIEMSADCSDEDDLMLAPFSASIWDYIDQPGDTEDDSEPIEIEVGRILAHRFDLSYAPENLIWLADTKCSDLYSAAMFLLNPRNYRIIEMYRYLFYIDNVFIEPQFRGRKYALKGVATFLNLFAKGEVVSCHPCPVDDLKEKYTKTKGQLIMKKYWSKLGLTNYSKKHNILWKDDWYMPEWLSNL